MTLVPGFTTASRPSMVKVTMPGFLGGGGPGGGAGLGGARGGGLGLFGHLGLRFAGREGRYCSTSPPIMLTVSKVGMRSASMRPSMICGSAMSMFQPGARTPSL